MGSRISNVKRVTHLIAAICEFPCYLAAP